MNLKIDTTAVVRHTNKLEKMHRSALPNAIRGTLNKAAFDVKQRTMPASADQHFEKRSPNFFKANSKVQMATGFDVRSMRAIVGFVSHNLKYNNEAVHELEQQEYGGKIDDRTFIPLDEARAGTNATPVRPSNRLREIRARMRGGSLSGIPNVAQAKGRSRKEQFIKTAIFAGERNYIIAGIHKQALYRVNAIRKNGTGTTIKVTPLHSFKAGRSVNIRNSTHFMREASLRSAAQMEQFYIQEAERQFAKIKR